MRGEIHIHLLREGLSVERLLARYLGRTPAALALTVAPGGKPELAGNPLHFSVSHTEGLSVCALAWDQPVGVDIERRSEGPRARAVVGRYFPKLEALDERAALSAWTAFEAIGKRSGRGVLGLASGEVRLSFEGVSVVTLPLVDSLVSVAARHVRALRIF